MSAQAAPAPVDVLVVGGGNAGLVAALAAREAGARVRIVESAPKAMRGGNSRHTRNLRCAHDEPDDPLVGRYPAGEFVEDLQQVTGGSVDQALALRLARESVDCPAWMRARGARFQSALQGTLQLDRTNAFFLGGGKALLNAYYRRAEALGVDVRYETEAVAFGPDCDRFVSVTLRRGDHSWTEAPKAVVLASGGFEANLSWLSEIWGEAANAFVVRGTPFNTGRVLRLMLDHGAQPVGDPSQCHAIAVDARSPKFDGGIVTRLDCIPFGVVVNRNADRFYDEGEDVWPKRYAIWGRLIAAQPEQVAYCVMDAKAAPLFLPSVYPPIVAESIPALAGRLGLPPSRLVATINGFNQGARPGVFDPARLDGCRTVGLGPDKTHWAQPIDTPPFWGYPMKPGITFTYLGVRVDDTCRVLAADGHRMANIFAAGEIMAGNVLTRGYVAGVGMTIGTVFGRIAGQGAAKHARG